MTTEEKKELTVKKPFPSQLEKHCYEQVKDKDGNLTNGFMVNIAALKKCHKEMKSIKNGD